MNLSNNMKNIGHPNLDEMKERINEKANLILEELTNANLEYFVKESVDIAKGVLKKYIFYIRKLFSYGDYAIKDMVEKERFTNFNTGYQQKMLDWIEQNKPNIELIPPRVPLEKKWHRVTLGIGTAGAIVFEVGRRCKDGERYWIGILIELVTLVASYFIYKKEKSDIKKYSEKLTECELTINEKKESFVNETISQLEKWLNDGETYSNELLTTFNLL